MISEILKVRLKELNLTVPQAAKRCGIPPSTLYSYVTYNTTPSAKILKKISDGLNITLNELLKEPEPAFYVTDEFRRAPGADAMFSKDGFYDRLTPEDKKMLETFLQGLKARYGGK